MLMRWKKRLDILLKEKEMNVDITERVKQIELEEKEIIRREKQYDAEVRKKTDIEERYIETACRQTKSAIWNPKQGPKRRS